MGASVCSACAYKVSLHVCAPHMFSFLFQVPLYGHGVWVPQTWTSAINLIWSWDFIYILFNLLTSVCLYFPYNIGVNIHKRVGLVVLFPALSFFDFCINTLKALFLHFLHAFITEHFNCFFCNILLILAQEPGKPTAPTVWWK